MKPPTDPRQDATAGQGTPAGQAAQIAPEPKAGLAGPLIAAVVAMFGFVTFPLAMAERNPDTSLNEVLHFASEHGLQFGTQVVSTYGPLGFLIFPHYSEHALGLRMATDLLVCFTVAFGACLVSCRLALLWRCVFLATLIWVPADLFLRSDWVFHTGLFCWGLLCITQSGRQRKWAVLVFAALVAFAALAKVSFLFVAGGGLVLICSYLALTGRAALAVSCVGLFALAFAAGWLGAGQHLRNIPAYMGRGLEVVQGYNGALGMEGLLGARAFGLIALLLATAALVVQVRRAAHDSKIGVGGQLLLLAWGLLFLLTSWKHGFVRADVTHVGVFLAFVPLFVLVLPSLAKSREPPGWQAAAPSFICWAVCLAAMQLFISAPFPSSAKTRYALFRNNLERVAKPSAYARLASETLETLETELQLPECRKVLGNAPVDVFGQNQACATFNNLNYRPRPVFQSYSACTARLMRLNEESFFASGSPDYWLFGLAPLDRKFAPLEDAWLLRDLLINCEFVLAEKETILLKRVSQDRPRLQLLQEGVIRPGEGLDLRSWKAENLWVELRLNPSLLGRLRQVAFRPPIVRLAAWREPGKHLIYRHQAAASMLAAGFLASPLLVRTPDLLSLFRGTAREAPGALSLDVGEGAWWWNKQIRFRVYKLENGLGQAGGSPGKISSTAPGLRKPNPDRPFKVFSNKRWRPELQEPGSANDILAFVLFVAAPIVSGGALIAFARRARSSKAGGSWRRLLLGNLLFLATLSSLALLAGECWFRFFYDTTDSLAYTKVTERWVQRHWRTNAAGCRDNIEYSPALPPGQKRLSIIGDSFTAGHGLNNVEARMANLLRQRFPDYQVHVLAHIGLDTGAEITLLKHLFGQGYQLDTVLLVYCLNDIGDLAPEQIQATESVLSKVTYENWLVRNSYLLNLLYERWQAWRHPYARNYGSYIGNMYNGPLWAKQQERLKTFQQLVQSRGGRLKVVTYPLFHNLGPAYPYRSVHEQLNRFWQELNVPHLDLLPCYDGMPGKELVVNPYDAHPNEKANRLAANAVEKFIAWTELPREK